jgi:hypothetical protein
MCDDIGSRNGVPFEDVTDDHTLTPAMICEMQDSGSVEFGGHTRSHPKLARLELAEARHEIAQGRKSSGCLIERCGILRIPMAASMPSEPGSCNCAASLGSRRQSRARSERSGRTTGPGWHDLPRLTINGEYEGDALPDLLLSGLLPLLRARLFS